MKLGFEPAAHRYTLDGAPVPSVTQILAPFYNFAHVPDETLEHKRQIGELLHLAIELDLKDNLRLDSIDPQIAGYFNGWLKFKAEKRFECYFAERPIGSKKFRYAGKLDFAGEIDGVESVIDGKTTAALHPAVALQTAGYLGACSEMGLIRSNARRYALRLKPDGTYILDQHKDRNDFAVFLSCLSLHNWRARVGLNQEFQ